MRSPWGCLLLKTGGTRVLLRFTRVRERLYVSVYGCEAVRVKVLLTSVCSQEFIVVFKLNCWKNKRGKVCLGAGVPTAGYDARSVVKTVCP